MTVELTFVDWLDSCIMVQEFLPHFYSSVNKHHTLPDISFSSFCPIVQGSSKQVCDRDADCSFMNVEGCYAGSFYAVVKEVEIKATSIPWIFKIENELKLY